MRLGFNAGTTGTQVLNNTTDDNRAVGILIQGTNTGVLVQGNVADHNQYGIRTTASATGTHIVKNSMHSNASLDALEGNVKAGEEGTTLGNVWQKNRCDTDSPGGTICGR